MSKKSSNFAAQNCLNMSELESLRNSLVLTVTESSEIESIFKGIAENLLNNFVIRKGDKLYRMVEIEFYYNLTDTAHITYERMTEAGEWFNHDFGVDLTFKSNEKSYGGILIRSIECDGKFCNGPRKTRDLLFQFDAFGGKSDVPKLEYCQRAEAIEPIAATRYNISEKQNFRYCIPRELWTEHKGYTAYPWDYKGNLKI